MRSFELISEFTPKGDQPEAIETLISGVKQDTSIRFCLG